MHSGLTSPGSPLAWDGFLVFLFHDLDGGVGVRYFVECS